MRNHLILELERLAEKDPSVVVLTADLGYSVLDSFARKFPKRCLNVGICEQNMASVAAGLALEGFKVYMYSIGNFPVMRCLEQIRNGICYHNANVKIIAVGGGFVYGQLGMSHHATEDLAITRALPNMRVFCPADPGEAVQVLRKAYEIDAPCYIRLARGGEPELHDANMKIDVSQLLEMRSGDKIAILATGPVLSEALTAADDLIAHGVHVGVYNCISLKPFDRNGLSTLAKKFSVLITIEEHNVIGGLASIVCDTLVECGGGHNPRVIKLGLQDRYTSVVGSQKYLRQRYELDAAAICRAVRKLKIDG